ncbi:MAG: hypothetical protein JL50_03850 [Peptococcaceae bacterium BICA1-7]|nr:MAG: hypothetical protein JL50_03850 [Peptococcaceae bacterium BICA1-7]HBV97603.1 DUF456 domain-containing protein [Desulfotomaculum sp.]
MTVLGFILAVLFFAAGLAGTILPALPGAPLIWLGMLAFGLTAGFEGLGLWFFIGQGLAVGLIFFIDYAAAAWGARRYGGSRAAVWGSLAGLVLGVLFLGPLGIVFGPFVGAVAGEVIVQKPLAQAVQSGMGTMLGMAGGLVLKLLVEAGMIIWFFMAVI